MSREKKLKILSKTLGSCYSKGEESLFFCPSCEHHKRKLSINVSKNVFKCWVCDWSGKNIYRIIRKYATNSLKYEWRSLEQRVDLEGFADKLFPDNNVNIKQEVSLPNEFVSLVNKKLPNTSIYPINYLKSRGIYDVDIAKWKIGYCATGKYAGRIVIPSFDGDGDLNYFITRAYDNDWKKYMNPNISRDIIFNDLYINFDDDVILVEGVFDAIKAGYNSVPLLGSTLNENSQLFYNIVKNDTPVYLALDPDASKKTSKLISLFLKYDIEIKLIDIDPYDDVGEMTHAQFCKRKQMASILDSHNYLLSRIAGI